MEVSETSPELRKASLSKDTGFSRDDFEIDQAKKENPDQLLIVPSEPTRGQSHDDDNSSAAVSNTNSELSAHGHDYKLFDIEDFDINDEVMAEIGTISNHLIIGERLSRLKNSVKDTRTIPIKQLKRINRQRKRLGKRISKEMTHV